MPPAFIYQEQRLMEGGLRQRCHSRLTWRALGLGAEDDHLALTVAADCILQFALPSAARQPNFRNWKACLEKEAHFWSSCALQWEVFLCGKMALFMCSGATLNLLIPMKSALKASTREAKTPCQGKAPFRSIGELPCLQTDH